MIIQDVVFKNFAGQASKKHDPTVGAFVCSSSTVTPTLYFLSPLRLLLHSLSPIPSITFHCSSIPHPYLPSIPTYPRYISPSHYPPPLHSPIPLPLSPYPLSSSPTNPPQLPPTNPPIPPTVLQKYNRAKYKHNHAEWEDRKMDV